MMTLNVHLLDQDFCYQVRVALFAAHAYLILAFQSELEHDVWSHSAW